MALIVILVLFADVYLIILHKQNTFIMNELEALKAAVADAKSTIITALGKIADLKEFQDAGGVEVINDLTSDITSSTKSLKDALDGLTAPAKAEGTSVTVDSKM